MHMQTHAYTALSVYSVCMRTHTHVSCNCTNIIKYHQVSKGIQLLSPWYWYLVLPTPRTSIHVYESILINTFLLSPCPYHPVSTYKIIAVSMWLPTPCKPANVRHVWPPCQQTACLNLFLSLNVPTAIKMLPTKIRPILAWVIIKIHPPHRVIFGLKPYTLGRP